MADTDDQTDTLPLDAYGASGGTVGDLARTASRDDAPTDTSSAKRGGDTDSIASMLSPDKAMTDDLLKGQREKVAAETGIIDQTAARAEEDRGYMRHMLAREGVAMDDVKPWDAKVERAKYRSDPIADFGSFASVFAIAASAFTKQPMANALNASAAAMNAVRERNDEEYKYAYQAWKDNTDLAVKRGNMMHQQYSDALSLFNTDVSLGDAKMKQLAVKFGDQQALTMMEHGMYPQLWEMMGSRAKAVEGMTKAVQASDEYSFRKTVFENDPRRKSENPQTQMQAWNEAYGVTTPVDQFIMQKWWAEHPGAGTEDAVKFLGEMNRAKWMGRGTDKSQFVAAKLDQLNEDPQTKGLPMPEKLKLIENEWNTVTKGQTPTNVAREHIKEDIKKEHPDWTAGQVDKEVMRQEAEAKKSGVTGNEKLKRESHIFQYRESIGTIDKQMMVLRKYIGAAGAPGMALRLKERVGNLFGSNQTDRVQFERDIKYLQLTATRLLLDQAAGRPLSAEQEKVKSIVAGLNIGDTTVNTIRALEDLKSRYDRLMKENERLLHGEGSGAAAPTGGASSTPAASGDNADAPWLRDPAVH